jgi:hypothetical protein
VESISKGKPYEWLDVVKDVLLTIKLSAKQIANGDLNCDRSNVEEFGSGERQTVRSSLMADCCQRI